MLRSGIGWLCGAALVWAATAGEARAQRPAAWDTRVRSPSPAAVMPQEKQTLPAQKIEPKEPRDAAHDRKAKYAKRKLKPKPKPKPN